MSKIQRVRSYGVQNYAGPMVFPLEAVDGQVSVWLRASSEVVVTAHFKSGAFIPLASGCFIDQAYHFESEIVNLEVYCAKSCRFAIRLLQAGTAYKDVMDPIPYRAIVPLDAVSDTMENRILRAIDSALSARGLSNRSRGAGVDYSDSDEDFGSGYEYDEDEDAELNTAAAKAIAEKFAARSGSTAGVQSSGNDDKDKSTRDKLGAAPADPSDTKPGNDPD